MDMTIIDTIANFITRVGFPIAMCLLVFFSNRQEVSELRKVISENTTVLAQLQQLIEDKLM